MLQYKLYQLMMSNVDHMFSVETRALHMLHVILFITNVH